MLANIVKQHNNFKRYDITGQQYVSLSIPHGNRSYPKINFELFL
jgi:hypothetical protein